MKRYRLKAGETLLLTVGGGLLIGKNGVPLDRQAALQLQIKDMSRFDWLYGEETDLKIILYIPYPLPYINFRIPVPKNLVEEIPE